MQVVEIQFCPGSAAAVAAAPVTGSDRTDYDKLSFSPHELPTHYQGTPLHANIYKKNDNNKQITAAFAETFHSNSSQLAMGTYF